MKPRVAVLSVFVAASAATLIGLTPTRANSQPELRSTIAFTSTRDTPTGEIYLIDPSTDTHAQDLRRLTNNAWGDAFPTLSPDGKRIVFDSNRLQVAGEPINTSDLFVMKNDGKEQTHLTRGSSATWSPDSLRIAFHGSASGTGLPIKTDPGAATSDSDIFVVNVGDLLDRVVRPTNITNTPQSIEDDADWSPDGRTIVFTSHSVTDSPLNSITAEIYLMRVSPHGMPIQGGQPNPRRLTDNVEEERAPSISPDGTRIVYMCHAGGVDFEICLMNADGTNPRALTNNTMGDLTPTWSPDGTQIVFHRALGFPQRNQLFLMTLTADGTVAAVEQLTSPPGLNLLANWGVVRIQGGG